MTDTKGWICADVANVMFSLNVIILGDCMKYHRNSVFEWYSCQAGKITRKAKYIMKVDNRSSLIENTK